MNHREFAVDTHVRAGFGRVVRTMKQLRVDAGLCQRCRDRAATCLHRREGYDDERLCNICAARTPLDQKRALVAEWQRR